MSYFLLKSRGVCLDKEEYSPKQNTILLPAAGYLKVDLYFQTHPDAIIIYTIYQPCQGRTDQLTGMISHDHYKQETRPAALATS